MTLTLSSLSTDYIQIPVSATVNGTSYDPTSDPVQIAFITSTAYPGYPTDSDWHTATWDTPSAGMYLAQVLVGPQNGGVVLTPGTWTAWIKITDDPEVPVRTPGYVVIT